MNSLRDNQQSTCLEEHEKRKYQPTCEKSLDKPLKEEKKNHEVEHQLPQADFREWCWNLLNLWMIRINLKKSSSHMLMIRPSNSCKDSN